MPAMQTTKALIHRVEIWDILPDTKLGQCRDWLDVAGVAESQRADPVKCPEIINNVISLELPKIFSIQANPELLDELHSKGAAAALVIPSFTGDNIVSSILCFYFRHESQAKAAVEIWVGEAGRYALTLDESYFPGLERFGFISRHVHFPIGSGLPGMVWESGNAVMINDLSQSNNFLRSTGAENEGLDLGLAFPCIKGRELLSVNLMLSTKDTPLMRICEIWQKDDTLDHTEHPPMEFPYRLEFIGGMDAPDLPIAANHDANALRESIVGHVARTESFQLWSRNFDQPRPAGWEHLTSNYAVGIPIFSLRKVVSIVVIGW